VVGNKVWPALLLLLASCTSIREQDDGFANILLRSDVPLWTELSGLNVTPRPMSANDIGCTGVDWHFFGEWKQTYTSDEYGDGPDPLWWRLHNTGSFHCAGYFGAGEERGGPTDEFDDGGYIVSLGHDPASGLDLVAWEIGMRGGSTYLLLAALPGERNQYAVLDPDCAFGQERRAADGSIFITEYCAIPDRAALRRTAVAAARRTPLGAMTRAEPDPEN
jgi:hypothetical protein